MRVIRLVGHRGSSGKRHHRGSAILILILSLSLLLATYSATMVKRMNNERVIAHQRNQIQMLEAAIAGLAEVPQLAQGEYRLPIDDSGRRVVVVEKKETPGNEIEMVARLQQADKQIVAIRRIVSHRNHSTGNIRDNTE